MPIDSILPMGALPLSRRYLALLIAVIIVGLLFYLGTKPFAADLLPQPLDKLVHFVFFSTLTVLLWMSTGGRLPLTIIALVTGVGALDEWHQAFLPGRTADYADFLTDFAAAACSIFVLQRLKK